MTLNHLIMNWLHALNGYDLYPSLLINVYFERQSI